MERKYPYGIVSTVLLQRTFDASKLQPKDFDVPTFSGSCFYVKDNVVHLLASYTTLKLEVDAAGNETVKKVFLTRENTYNTETKVLTEELTSDDLLNVDTINVCEFCKQVIMDNNYLLDAMDALQSKMDTISDGGMCSGFTRAHNGQFYKLAVHRQDIMEQLLKTSPQMLFNPKALMAINLDEKSVKRAVNLPTAVMDDLVKKKRESFIQYFNVLCEDGNDAVILNDFLNSLKTLTKAKRTTAVNEFIGQFLSDLTKAKTDDSSMTVTEILRYALHQTMYHTTWNMDGFRNVCSYFKDYTNMRMLWSVKDRYPNNIFEAHDLLTRNVNGYTDADKEAFKTAVSGLKTLERVVVVNKGKDDEESYSFIVPQTIDDLILEGVNLHHCIGSWGKKIINGSTRIVFMRKTRELETSLATIELDENLKVIQSKVAYNEELPDDLQSVVKTYEKKLKP